MKDPAPLGAVLGETLSRVRSKYSAAPVSSEASERQARREQLARIEKLRRLARDPALGLPQGPSMLARALGKPAGRVGAAMQHAYDFARGSTRRTCTLFVGSNPGSGKTTGAVRAVIFHVERGDTALYVRAPLLPSVRNHTAAPLYDQVRAVDLLVIDELGMEADASAIINLILERHDNERVTFLLGNLTSEETIRRYALTDDARMRSRFRGLVKSGLKSPVVAIEDRDLRGGNDSFAGGAR